MEHPPEFIVMPMSEYLCDFCGRAEVRPPLILFVGAGDDMRSIELCTNCMAIMMRGTLPDKYNNQNQPDDDDDTGDKAGDKDISHD